MTKQITSISIKQQPEGKLYAYIVEYDDKTIAGSEYVFDTALEASNEIFDGVKAREIVNKNACN